MSLLALLAHTFGCGMATREWGRAAAGLAGPACLKRSLSLMMLMWPLVVAAAAGFLAVALLLALAAAGPAVAALEDGAAVACDDSKWGQEQG